MYHFSTYINKFRTFRRRRCIEKRPVLDAINRLRQGQTCKPYRSIPFQGLGKEAFQNHKCIIYARIRAEPSLFIWLLFIHHHPQSVVKQLGKYLYIIFVTAMGLQLVGWELSPDFGSIENSLCCHDISKEPLAIIELYISNKYVCKGMLLYLTFPRRFHLHLLPCHKIVLFYMYATQNWIKSLYVLQHLMQDSRCRSRKVSIRSSIHPLPGRLKLQFANKCWIYSGDLWMIVSSFWFYKKGIL